MPNKTINHVSMQKLASFVILLAMSPVLLVLVVVSTTYLAECSSRHKWNPGIDNSAKPWTQPEQDSLLVAVCRKDG